MGINLVDLPLPGDEEQIIRYRTRLAVKRDNRLTQDEHLVYLCTSVCMRYGTSVCLSYDCAWCGGGGWGPRDREQANLFDTWP